MKTVWQLVLVAFSLCIVGCGSGSVDTSDPQQVAEAFWNALIAQDYDAAALQVLEEDRESFRREAVAELRRMPPFPSDPRIRVEGDGDERETLIENWETEARVEMVLRDGRWWITE